MSTMPLPRSLRSNHNAHPGIADKPRPKRTPEEVQATKAAKESELASCDASRTQTIESTAILEENMRADYQQKMKNASNPPLTGQRKLPREKSPVRMDSENFSDNNGDQLGDQPQVDVVSTDSGDSYKVGLEEEEGDDGEDDMMDVDSESDSNGQQKPRRRKKPAKGSLQSAVKAAQEPTVTEVTSVKRKPSAASEKPSKAKKSKGPALISTGFHSNWSERINQVDVAGNSASMKSRVPNQRDNDSDIGGISDNGGELAERRTIGSQKAIKTTYFGGRSQTSETKVQSVAKIEATTSVATFINPTTREKFRVKKEAIRLGHLPPHIQAKFDTSFVPRACEVFGHTYPWTSPSESDLEDVWRRTFPTDADDLSAMVLKLIDDRLHSWRNKFAKTALVYLQDTIFPKLPDNSKTQRSQWCTWAISGEAHNHPFYYHSYKEDDNGKIKCSGIFQSTIISAVLATHISAISSIPLDEQKEDRPVGALVLTIQAVKRAISMWTTGEKVEQPRPFNDFSKTNWGDTTENHEGRTFPVLTTTNLVRVALKLKDKQWDKLIGAAMQASKGKKSIEYAPSSDPLMAPADDFEIIDDDSDLSEEEEAQN